MFKIYTKLYFEEPFLNFSLLWAMGMRWWQAASKYIHRASNYSSMSISNMIGPVEQMVLVKHPVKGLYFMTLKVPQVYNNSHKLTTFGFSKLATILSQCFVYFILRSHIDVFIFCC